MNICGSFKPALLYVSTGLRQSSRRPSWLFYHMHYVVSLTLKSPSGFQHFFFLNEMKEKIKGAFCMVANDKLTNLYKHLVNIQSTDIHGFSASPSFF